MHTCSGSVDGANQLIIKGRFQQKQIETVLRRYISESAESASYVVSTVTVELSVYTQALYRAISELDYVTIAI